MSRFHTEEKYTMNVKKITPVLFVPEVEPCVKFWVERFGFEKTAEVPDGDKLAFALLQKANVELMYQSYASADKDVGSTISQVARKGPTFLCRSRQPGPNLQRSKRRRGSHAQAQNVLWIDGNRHQGSGRALRHVRRI
jgi:hypothetical protein